VTPELPSHDGPDASDTVDLNTRDRVTVAGPDAAGYLQSQIAQDISDLQVGASRWTLVLDPTGKIDSLARITRTADEMFEFDTDAGFGDGLVARLSRFKIRVNAEISATPARSTEPDDTHEAERIAVGWPRMGFEIVPGETIPATTGIESVAVSFTKGCYPGQELVERMNSRGADAPKALRILDVGPGAAVGDPVLDESGATVGELTSVSPTGTTALGFVKRGHHVGRPPAHVAST
jgi:tRNA-modifying protein YgfZ